jgi:thiosulfate reductase cytochrome b subunit
LQAAEACLYQNGSSLHLWQLNRWKSPRMSARSRPANDSLLPPECHEREPSAMSTAAVKSSAIRRARLHPLPLRIMHWINAVAVFIMIGSGWRIYNDDVLFGWLHFPDLLVIGKWAQYGLQWHFFGMWIFALNGLAYLTYGIITGRFRQKFFPISLRDVLLTIGDALRLRLSHEDLTVYNAAQKSLYFGVILVGIAIVITGLCLWKPVQFSEVAGLFGNFQTIRLIHFLCMSAIVAFVTVHVILALLVPRSLAAMITGGPVLNGRLVLGTEGDVGGPADGLNRNNARAR